MTRPADGGCQCGAVRYRLTGEPLGLIVCHCRECQRQSGSAFGMSLMCSRYAFALLSGELATFTRKCDSGQTLDCSFCPRCGTRIHHARSAASDSLSIKPGTLDETSWLVPGDHLWVGRKQPWTPIPDGARCFEAEPDY